MLGFHAASAQRYRGGIDALHTKIIQRYRRAYHIQNGVHRPYLMEVNIRQGHTVNFGFGLPQFREELSCHPFYRLAQTTAGDQIQNLAQIAGV